MKNSFSLKTLLPQSSEQLIGMNVQMNLETNKQQDYFVNGALPPINLRSSVDNFNMNFKQFKIDGLLQNSKRSQSTIKMATQKDTDLDNNPTQIQEKMNLQTISFVNRNTLKNEMSLFSELKKIYHPASIKEQNLKTYREIYQNYDEGKQFVSQGVLTGRHFSKFLKPKKEKTSLKISEEMKVLRPTKEPSLIDLQKKLQVANVLLNVKYNVYEKNNALSNMIQFYQSRKSLNSMKSAQFYSNLKTIFLKKKKMKQLLAKHFQELETQELQELIN